MVLFLFFGEIYEKFVVKNEIMKLNMLELR